MYKKNVSKLGSNLIIRMKKWKLIGHVAFYDQWLFFSISTVIKPYYVFIMGCACCIKLRLLSIFVILINKVLGD